MSALLCDIGKDDEVIMPSFTFSSTANAFILRGAVPVFIDIDPRTQNIDPGTIEAAITSRTKVIVPVHYAGVACDMDAIMAIAERHGLFVIEDAAQALLSRHRGRPLGTIGHLAALSFHDSKNVPAGEAGALLVNDPRFAARAEIIREKGTNRTQFLRGEIDKYTWMDVGSSFLPNEITAALLLAQLEQAEQATISRRAVWTRYFREFVDLEPEWCWLPKVPSYCEPNGHIFYLVLPRRELRDRFIDAMKRQGINALFHYVALHDSPAGSRFGRTVGTLKATKAADAGLVRLPIWSDMPDGVVDHVINAVRTWMRGSLYPRLPN
jgi:dTDP-4-amino-4,6-dideoxygalactose transaminase